MSCDVLAHMPTRPRPRALKFRGRQTFCRYLFLNIFFFFSTTTKGSYSGEPVVHNWFIKGRGMYSSVYGKVHIKDPLLLIEKSSLCGDSGFPSKKCVNVTI